MADGYVEVRGESAYKRGRVPSDVAAAYESHKQALRAAISAGAAPYRTAELLEPTQVFGLTAETTAALTFADRVARNIDRGDAGGVNFG